jgi:hypothetical protein
MRHRLIAFMTAIVFVVSGALLAAGPASAAPADKLTVLGSWTGTSASSYRAFFDARANRSAWSAYGFDWSTDYCSTSPDNPFGFPFQNSCVRHDFGYRNYRKAGTFTSHKERLDRAFHADLKRVCARYTGTKRGSCLGVAWTYYRAAVAFG